MANRRIRAMLDRTVQHIRPVFTEDALGGKVAADATQTADVPAAIWPVSANDAIAGMFEREDIATAYSICTDSDIGVKANDKIIDGTDEYIVRGAMKYEDAKVMRNTVVYVIAANLRKV